jgi:hypothetical protein
MYMSVVMAVAAVVLASGCGSDDEPADPPPAPAAAADPRPQRLLAALSRVVGTDPMVDEIVVGVEGRVEVRRLRGGAGARFDHYRLRRRELARLRRDLARVVSRRFARPGIELGRWFYTLRVRGREPDYFVGGRVARPARPAIRRLNRLIDSSSERDPDYEPE